MRIRALLCVLSVLAYPAIADVPSRPGVGSPELAFAGPSAVGIRTLRVTEKEQVNPLRSLETGAVVRSDRVLPLSVWYPAKTTGTERIEPYAATLGSEPPLPPIALHIPSIAVPDAPPQGGGYPVVLLSHGYNNDPVILSWLTENLASKGFVVVAISHNDPGFDRSKTPAALLQRPFDIAFVLQEIRRGLLGALVDTHRIALVGYSMGGYGVLTSAGARLDAASSAIKSLPHALSERYVAGGADAASLVGGDIKAVVAISPAGGAPWQPWGVDGLSGIRAPLLVITGEMDRTVGFEQGPAAIFAAAAHSDRYMLVFRGAGHSLGTDPAPPEMRTRLWDLDWFEDPVWSKERINAISLHFVTAFLDLHLKSDASRAAYLRVPREESDRADWVSPDSAYDAVSQGGDNPTWKGFPRNHQAGLILRHLDPVP
jgi:predicted dienelactone hydrolase